MLALGNMLPKGGPISITPDGKSIVMTALNNNWVWTYTPSTSDGVASDLDDLELDR